MLELALPIPDTTKKGRGSRLEEDSLARDRLV